MEAASHILMLSPSQILGKQDAAHEPECSRGKHYNCEASYLWNVQWGGTQGVECEERGVLSGECSV